MVPILLAAILAQPVTQAPAEQRATPDKPAPQATPQPEKDKPAPPSPAAPAVKPTRAAADLTLAAKGFASESACAGCGGKGKVVRSVQTGTRKGPATTLGPRIVYPVYEDREETCDSCKGDGVAAAARVRKAAEAFASALDKLPEDAADEAPGKAPDKALDKALETATEQLRAVASRGLFKLSERLNDAAVTRVTAVKPQLGTPVVFVGTLIDDKAKDGARTNKAWLGTTTIALEDCRIIDASWGERVLIGGMLVRRDEDKQGHWTAVLQHGFIVREAKRP